MGYKMIHEDNEFSWEWNNQFHELEIVKTTHLETDKPCEEIRTVMRIPISVAIEMVRELHHILEFEEAYDAHQETSGG